MTKAGFLFVVPWDVRNPGGVVHAVLGLFRQADIEGTFTPRLLISSWQSSGLVEALEDGRWTCRLRLRSPIAGGNKWASLAKWLVFALPTAIRLRRYLSSRHIAVVNVHYPSLSALLFCIAGLLTPNRPTLILSFHGMDLVQASRSLGLERWLWGRLFTLADYVVGCSRALATSLASFQPSSSERIVAIQNGIDLEAFLSERNPDFALDSRLRGRTYILSVATFEPKKGLDVLIHAFSLLVEKVTDQPLLVLVGADNGALSGLRSLVSELGLADKVLFFENLQHSQVHVLFAGAALFCLPSRNEPFGLVLLEAGAFACPVIATSVGGITEIISHGRTGRLVPPENPLTLAAELHDLLSKPEERSMLGSALRERVAREFTWSRAFNSYRHLSGRTRKHSSCSDNGGWSVQDGSKSHSVAAAGRDGRRG